MCSDFMATPLLLTLPIVNCSQSVESAICQKYVRQWDKHHGSTLNERVSVVPFTVKTHIVCALCSVIEYQQRFKLAAAFPISVVSRRLQSIGHTTDYILAQFAIFSLYLSLHFLPLSLFVIENLRRGGAICL